jgi:ABC-type transport system involved in multi-copper enzyme maturation permease subunit
MEKTKHKGKPFLEIFASTLQEDYRFPILEIFAFLYALGTFIFVSFGSTYGVADERIAFGLVTSLMGFPMFIFIILIFKNVAYGLGSDLEKGTIQTFFSYPLKRRSILTAKLLSAIGLALSMFLLIQMSALYLLTPDIIYNYSNTVILTYLANISYPLFLTAVLLLVTLATKRGGLALVFGIILYFALGILNAIIMFISYATKSILPLQILSIINPTTALQQYYYPSFWSSCAPTFNEVLGYLSGAYIMVIAVFLVAYYYFCRRLNL